VWFSRVWRVWGCVSLQMWGGFLAFGGFGVAYRSKRAQLFRHLLSVFIGVVIAAKSPELSLEWTVCVRCVI